MSFDKNKFLQTKFSAREDIVPVPDMKEFFLSDDEKKELEKIDSLIAKNPNGKGLKKNFIAEKKALIAKAVWKVRGLTGVEVARSNEAMERNRNISAILEGLISSNAREKVDSVKKLIGIDEKVPNEIAKRIELLILGSVDPEVDTELAVKICGTYPIEFYEITNKITLLTGQGHMPGKQKPCGETKKSN